MAKPIANCAWTDCRPYDSVHCTINTMGIFHLLLRKKKKKEENATTTRFFGGSEYREYALCLQKKKKKMDYLDI
jgi:hypothetical protein